MEGRDVEGRAIGSYQVERCLATGGMGAVYLAVHAAIGKRVAVKVLHEGMCQDPELVSRFFHEARAVNEIRHPNIVDVFDFGTTDDGIYYLIMEFLEGKTLRAVMEPGPVALPRALAIARQMGAALGAAHKVGIVHRDLKPANVMVIADEAAVCGERVKVLDFGMAKLLGGERRTDHQTRAGIVVGTPRYMAPEQLLERPVDARADIYAFGAVLFELVTGQRPFDAAELLDYAKMVVNAPPRRPRALRADVPDWLEALLLRCLEKGPELRPQTMAEVVDTLTRGGQLLGHAPRGVHPVPSIWRPREAPPTASALPAVAPPVGGLAGLSRPTASALAAVATPTPSPIPARARGAEPRPPTRKPEGPRRSAAIAPLEEEAAPAPRPTWVKKALGLGALGAAAAAAALLLLGEAAPPPAPAAPPTVVERRAARPPAAQATILLSSIPAGADVVRSSDGVTIGKTPTVDARVADGGREEYRIRRRGYAEGRIPIELARGGEHRLSVTLVPLGRGAAARRGAEAAETRQPRAGGTRLATAPTGEAPAERPLPGTPAEAGRRQEQPPPAQRPRQD